MKRSFCGSFASCDCFVEVTEASQCSYTIESVVDVFFHDQIEQVIVDVLNEFQHPHVHVKLTDKGAFDYTIEARLRTALKRYHHET